MFVFSLSFRLSKANGEISLYRDSLLLRFLHFTHFVRYDLKGCRIYAVQTTLGLDYKVSYKQVYGPQTAADMIKILNWLKDFMSAQIKKGSKVYLIKLWQGKEISPKEVKKEEIRTNAWSIFGDGDIIFCYGTLYEFN